MRYVIVLLIAQLLKFVDLLRTIRHQLRVRCCCRWSRGVVVVYHCNAVVVGAFSKVTGIRIRVSIKNHCGISICSITTHAVHHFYRNCQLFLLSDSGSVKCHIILCHTYHHHHRQLKTGISVFSLSSRLLYFQVVCISHLVCLTSP